MLVISCGGGLGGDHLAHVLALAQHHHAVGDVLHLVQLVGDDDDRLAVVAHVAQHREELVGLLRGEHGGGLVEDEDLGAAVEQLDDLDRLLLRDGHVVDLLVGVHVKAVGVADLADALGGGREVELALLLEAQHDVLGGGEDVHQLEVLVDHADAVVEGVLGRADDHGLAVDLDGAAVGEVDARQHVHERGLAAAVLAEQGQDLAAVDVEVDVLVCNDLARELLGDAPHPHGWLSCLPWSPFSCLLHLGEMGVSPSAQSLVTFYIAPFP